jgi:hypothetical protein
VTRENVEASLDAVERALAHLAESLDRAGFVAGASAYQQMSDVVLGQRVWAESEGLHDLRPRFYAVASLAGRIHDALDPYVVVMRRLRLLEMLEADVVSEDAPPSLADAIVRALRASADGLTATALGRAVGVPSSAVKDEIVALVAEGVVERRGTSSRPRYVVAQQL